jgi:hypothetical protein
MLPGNKALSRPLPMLITHTKQWDSTTASVATAPYSAVPINLTLGLAGPSFYAPIDNESVAYDRRQQSWYAPHRSATAVQCGAHLGHLFEDGPAPTGPALLHQLRFLRLYSRSTGVLKSCLTVRRQFCGRRLSCRIQSIVAKPLTQSHFEEHFHRVLFWQCFLGLFG